MNTDTTKYTYTCNHCGYVNNWSFRAARTDPTCGQCDYPNACREEAWRPIPGHSYCVSDQGHIARMTEGEALRPLKIHPNHKNGHLFVVLHHQGCASTHNVRRLVAQAFLPPPELHQQLQFLDGDKTNCRADNLRWRTRSEAIKESYDRGERHKPTRFTVIPEAVREEIKTLWKTGKFSQVQIGTMYGLSNSTISKVVRNITAAHTKKYTPTFFDPSIFENAMKLAARPKPYEKGPKAGPMGQALARAAEFYKADPTIGIGRLARMMGVTRHCSRGYLKRLRTPGVSYASNATTTGTGPETRPTHTALEQPTGSTD